MARRASILAPRPLGLRAPLATTLPADFWCHGPEEFDTSLSLSLVKLALVSTQPLRSRKLDETQRVKGRAYQSARDPERVLIEERAKALSAAGYPLPEDDSAMYAEQRLREAREAAREPQPCLVSEVTPIDIP